MGSRKIGNKLRTLLNINCLLKIKESVFNAFSSLVGTNLTFVSTSEFVRTFINRAILLFCDFSSSHTTLSIYNPKF